MKAVFKSRMRHIALWSVATVVVLAVLYAAWWQVLADHWQTGIDRWTAMVAKQGWTVTTGDRTVSGFPFTMRIALPAPKAQDTAGNGWTGPATVLEISPFMPLEPRFTSHGRHTVTLAGHVPLAIDTDSVTGHLVAARGGPTSIMLQAQHVASGDVVLDGFMLDLRKLDAKPDDPNAATIAAVSEIDRLVLPEGLIPILDREVSVAHLALRLRGTIPPGPPAQSLATWRDAGGTIELDSFDLDWPPLTGAGNATLALDKNLQPELAGSVTIRGLPLLIDRMVQTGMLKPGPAVAAKVVLGLAAKEDAAGMPENKVAVTIQNRVFSIGPAKIAVVPEVKW
jgi:hypothetical protein